MNEANEQMTNRRMDGWMDEDYEKKEREVACGIEWEDLP